MTDSDQEFETAKYLATLIQKPLDEFIATKGKDLDGGQDFLHLIKKALVMNISAALAANLQWNNIKSNEILNAQITIICNEIKFMAGELMKINHQALH